MNKTLPTVGIDDISFYIPTLYLDIEDLGTARGIDPGKLKHGLGLQKMSIPDSSEDVITMAAEALLDLVKKNNLQPADISRIYVGTESMVDGSKPIASYLLGILSEYFQELGIEDHVMTHCDVVDMVFACIGAVDALQNTLDYIRLRPQEKAIIIATDWAKYELDSPGESTQGAGAFAVLVSADPRLIKIDSEWGISTQNAHDFYKPLRKRINYDDIINSNGVSAHQLGKSIQTFHEDTPVYDGQYSNQCYSERMDEAFKKFMVKQDSESHPLDDWEGLVFHLPYAYHARRVFIHSFIDYLRDTDQMEDFVLEYEEQWKALENQKQLYKAYTKTEEYRAFVQQKIAPGEEGSSQIGNLYTGSIFMSLISTLSSDESRDYANKKLGFFAYGSGSKSKVFQGTVMPEYKSLIDRLNLRERLENRQRINFYQYEYLHKQILLINLDSVDRKVFQKSSGWVETNRYARTYAIRQGV